MRDRRIGARSRTVLSLLSSLAILGAGAPAAAGAPGPGYAPASLAPARADAPRFDRPVRAQARAEPVAASVARTNRVVVRWSEVRSTATPAVAAAAARKHVAAVATAGGHGARLVRTTGSGTAVYELGSPLGSDAKRILAALRRVPGAVSVEPDLWMTAENLPNDPQAANLWGLLGPADGSPFGIDVLSAWPTTDGTGVVVAVLDTGLVSHPDLAGQSVPGYDMISVLAQANDGNLRDPDASDPGDACSPRKSSWHGTHVAGTIAAVADNGIGVFGGAPGVKIQPVRVLGTCGGYGTDVADGIRWAAGGTVPGVPANSTPARVLNLSLSGQSPDCPSYYQDAIADARAHGAVVVVAAGNLGADAAGSSPANCANAMTVAAIDVNGKRASFSNDGAGVDIAGPGVGIISTIDTGATVPVSPTYAAYNGTSMATPHVVLSAALVAAMEPGLPPDAIEAVLQGTTTAFSSDPSDKSCQVLG
ncbi:MAG TPA: S8 family serine peptidase, partial [Candidatus Limnocylindrales bacterium]|nr:S8 family serine peptidase [Candidatus Limnocylindrales bacterium]